MKILLLIPLLFTSLAFGQALPDDPQPQAKPMPKTWEEAKGKPANFFTYRTNWQDPKLRTNRQVLKSPVFWMSQGLLWAPMIVACKNPSSGEHFHSEFPAVAFMTGASYLTDRYMSEMYSPLIAGIFAHRYIQSDLK